MQLYYIKKLESIATCFGLLKPSSSFELKELNISLTTSSN